MPAGAWASKRKVSKLKPAFDENWRRLPAVNGGTLQSNCVAFAGSEWKVLEFEPIVGEAARAGRPTAFVLVDAATSWHLGVGIEDISSLQEVVPDIGGCAASASAAACDDAQQDPTRVQQ